MTAVLVATNKTSVSYDILCLAVVYWIVLNHVLNTTHLMHLMKWRLFITYGTRDWSLPPVYVLIMDEISLVQTEQNSSVFFFFFLLPAPLQLYLCICVFTFFFLSRFCLLSLMLCFNNWQSVMLFQDAQSKGLFPSCFPLPNGKLKRVGWIGRGGSTFLVFSCIWLQWVSHSELQTLTHALSTFSALGLSANRVQQTQKPLNPLL